MTLWLWATGRFDFWLGATAAVVVVCVVGYGVAYWRSVRYRKRREAVLAARYAAGAGRAGRE